MPSTDKPIFSARPRVSIDGSERANVEKAVLSVQIHLPRIGMANAELRLLNWGPTDTDPDFLFQEFRLGSKIEIFLGELADSAAFSGEITAIEERYGDGAPQIVILAEDALHRLARQRHSRAFADTTLDDVVREIAGEAGLQADVNVSAGTGTWLQVNESNLAFLLRVLAPLDVGLRLHDGQLRVRDEEPDPEPLALDPGGKAKEVRIIADLNHLPRQVSVKGHNLNESSDAEGTASSLSPAPAGRSGTAILAELGWEGDSVLPHPFASTQTVAEALAQRQFRQRANRFLHGEIVCDGTIGLRSGREVELSGVSPRLAGRYRVMDCWHRFDNEQGLTARIRVQRPDWNP